MSSLAKFYYVNFYLFSRFFLLEVSQIKIQNYSNELNLIVDFFLTMKYSNIKYCFSFLKKSLLLSFDQLINLTCIDNLNLKSYDINNRFTLVYILNKINTASRLIILVNFEENNLIPSITDIYKDSNWLEREVFDLFGIFFINNPDLRRILTDYGFNGFPLRKDFPLTGYVEVRYNEFKKYVRYQPLIFMQEFRFFNFFCLWGQYHDYSLFL